MRTVTVELDGQAYEVEELRSRANRAWRKELEGHFTELAEALSGAPEADLTDGQALAVLVRSVSGKLLGSVDIIIDLVGSYAPDLPLDDAYDSEILDAFTGVLSLAYPFGSMIETVTRAIGEMSEGTTPSSPSANGDDGTTTSTR